MGTASGQAKFGGAVGWWRLSKGRVLGLNCSVRTVSFQVQSHRRICSAVDRNCSAVASLIVALLASGVTGSVAAEGDPKPNEIASGELPPRVDLRPQFVELGLTQRIQGRRGTCSVFATVEGLEFALARSTGRGERLSIEFANWAANSTTGRTDDGDFFHNIIKGIQARGICTDTAMPYEKEFSAERAPSP